MSAFGVSFFFLSFFLFLMNTDYTVQETLCTVHGTHNHFVQEKKIKNGSYGTIHTFKNYFATVFSVFSKINCIQMDPKCAFGWR